MRKPARSGRVRRGGVRARWRPTANLTEPRPRLQVILTDRAPKPIGPYSQAIRVGNLVFCSGQIGLNPSGEFMNRNIREQVRRCLTNLQAVLEAAGSSLGRVVCVTVYLTDLKNFQAMNEVFSEFFKEPYPSRTTVEVSKLPRGALVEMDAIAYAG